MTLDDDARTELRALEAAGRLRVPRVVDGAQGPRVTLDGVEVVSFASNDYLALAGDGRLVRAATAAATEDGAGAGASRLIVGNHRRHVGLERAICDWLRCGGVRLFGSGYAANVGVLSALVGAEDVVISDELNHASIIDGCRLSRARVVVVPHRDLGAFERALAGAGGRRRVVVSETLFSMDGDLADVGALSELCRRHDAALVLDEAHAIGVRGPEGRGVAAEAGVVPDVLVGTCGKALGSYGAFVATSAAIAELLWNRARPFVFSTGLPPMVAAATEAAIAIVRGREGEDRRRRVASHAQLLRSRIVCGGARDSAIAPIIVCDDQRALQLTARLLEERLYVQGIRPPTVPEGTARLRVSVSSGHSAEDVEFLSRSLDNAVRQ